jgi:hypothetical protein
MENCVGDNDGKLLFGDQTIVRCFLPGCELESTYPVVAPINHLNVKLTITVQERKQGLNMKRWATITRLAGSTGKL